MHPSVHSSAIHSSQDVEATSVSINRCMDKEDVIHTHTHTHTHTDCYSAIRKKERMPFAAT